MRVLLLALIASAALTAAAKDPERIKAAGGQTDDTPRAALPEREDLKPS